MDRKYWYWINNLEGIGNVKIRTLLSLGTPEELYNMERKEFECLPVLTGKDIDRIVSKDIRQNIFEKYQKDMENNVRFVFPDEEDYPCRLKELYDKPYILYYKGRLPRNDVRSVAIVGSRRCSEYGRYAAREIAGILSEAGACIISGLAAGIDSEAHKGALYKGGYTCGVLAGGVEKCYPAGNFNLYMDIQNRGGIISEYPGESITTPGMFPLRNRIISGLSDYVIVAEAGFRSGSLITAGTALEQNRTVYAVPGRITDDSSKGCNRLIADGAMVVTDFESLPGELGLSIPNCEKNIKNDIVLARDEKMLYSLLLDFTPKSLETLVNDSGMSPAEVLRSLTCLEIKGIIREISKNFYVRIQ